MTIRPIIFSEPMVRALLNRRKTQTRRLATSPLRKCESGDLLYVRETFAEVGEGYLTVTRSDYPHCVRSHFENVPPAKEVTWRPSIHMPRRLSRITLRIEAVRIEPLNSLTEADAIAEGIVQHKTCGWHVPGVPHPIKEFPILSRPTAREMYAALWDTLHGSGEWLGNPDVLVLTFVPLAGNVDKLAA